MPARAHANDTKMLSYYVLSFMVGVISFVTAPLRWIADFFGWVTDYETMSLYTSMEQFAQILNGLMAEFPFMRIVWSLFWSAVFIKFLIWVWEKWLKWLIERIR